MNFETTTQDYAEKIAVAKDAIDGLVHDWKMSFDAEFTIGGLVYYLTELADTMFDEKLGLAIERLLKHDAIINSSITITYGKENYTTVYVRLTRTYYSSDVDFNIALFAVKKIMSKFADEVSFTANDTQRFWFDKS